MTPSGEWIADNLQLRVYDKACELQGWVGLPISVDVDGRCNEIGSITFTLDVPDTDATVDEVELFDALIAEGARVRLHYRPLTGPLLTGMVHTWEDDNGVTATFTVVDDLIVLTYLLGWAQPDVPLADQAEPFYTATGPAETVLKDLVLANLANYPDVNLTVAPDLGRGDTISVQVRFDKLGDTLLKPIDGAGLRVTVLQQDDGTRLLDVVPFAEYEVPLTDIGGIVESWKIGMASPTATDTIAGDKQTAGARGFTALADDTMAGRFGERIVQFVDANTSDLPDDIETKQRLTLLNGRATYTAAVELVETDDFAFGDELPLGTQVQLQLGRHPLFTDRIRSVAIHLTATDGLVVTPQVGDLSTTGMDDAQALTDALRRIDKSERR